MQNFDHHLNFVTNIVIDGSQTLALAIKFGSFELLNEFFPEKAKTMANDEQNNAGPVAPEIDALINDARGRISYVGLTEEFKAERRRKLFCDRKFYVQDLITKNENGTNNYEKVIEYIKFLEDLRKDLASVQQGWDLALRWGIEHANLEERKKIAEADKKYKPKFEEREAAERKVQTSEEKKIKSIMAVGLTRTQAEKILKGEKL